MTLRVALTLRVTQAAGYHEPRDSISHDWLKRLIAWNMTPILIPNLLADGATYLTEARPDILVLTGGDDLGLTPERDAQETRLLDQALATRLPVLGVCRGLELANLHCGGRLAPVEGHVAEPHTVSVTEVFGEIYGAVTQVNSFHALTVPASGLGRDLQTAATDAEGNVEALVHSALPLAAVMWHPEREPANPGDRLLIERLARQGAFWT